MSIFIDYIKKIKISPIKFEARIIDNSLYLSQTEPTLIFPEEDTFLKDLFIKSSKWGSVSHNPYTNSVELDLNSIELDARQYVLNEFINLWCKHNEIKSFNNTKFSKKIKHHTYELLCSVLNLYIDLAKTGYNISHLIKDETDTTKKVIKDICGLFEQIVERHYTGK
jgi:hypothetical protein